MRSDMRLRIPVLEPDGHGGARVRTERKPSGPRVHRRGEGAERLVSEPWRRTGYGAGYRDARQICIERAGGRCERCGLVVAVKRVGRWACTTGQTHHRVPLRGGGPSSAENLVLLCPSCHAKADARLRRSGNC